MPDWYVLQVLTGKEQEITSLLARDGFEAFSPRRLMYEQQGGIWKQVERTMLAGYVFVSLTMSVRAYARIRDTNGVIRFLGTGMPETVPSAEMDRMLLLRNDGAPWGLSEGHIDKGSLKIDTGPLVGWEDQIIKLDARRYRAKVNLSLLGKEKTVELALTTTGNPTDQPGDTSPEDDEGEQTEVETPDA